MSIKQRAYPQPGQVPVLYMHLGHARYVYNLALEQRKLADATSRARGVRITAASQSRELTQARKEFAWLHEGSTVVQQGALRDLDRAFTNFFSGIARFPRFKKRGGRESFVVRDVRVVRYNRKWAALAVPKIGLVKFRLTRQWSEVVAATSARISYHNGQWHVSLTTPPRGKHVPGSGGVVGLDRGVAVTVMSSDGQGFTAPTFTEGEAARYLALERRLATQTKGSRRREGTKRRLAALRVTVANRRREWVEQTTTQIARAYTSAGIENLSVKSMTKKPAPKPDGDGGWLPNGAAARSGLSRVILASQWGRFAQRLCDKMDVTTVPAAYTSQCCFQCGHIDRENRKSQAIFRCTRCGLTDNADVNAAKIIRELAVCGRTAREWAKARADANLQHA